MNIDLLLEELYSYSMFGIKLGLENIKQICYHLGNPEKNYKIIHVSGTNGKGSTSTTIEQILLESGVSVGKYTSPHITDFNERITHNGIQISNEDIAKNYHKVKEIIEKYDINATFFEITTAMMFNYFNEKKTDYVVLEVGMGGRFDATNIVDAEIAIITNVSLDHTEYLGQNIYAISKEKAGIIKNAPNVIIGDSNPEFLKAINEETTHYINVLDKYKDASYDLDFTNFFTNIKIGDNLYKYGLFGDYQFKNFLCAYEAAKILKIDEATIKKAVTKVTWKCRFEVFSKNPLIIFDGAHNLNAIIELKKIISGHYKRDEVAVLTSILGDKDIKAMLKEVKDFSNNIIITSIPNNSRALLAKEIFDLADDKDGLSYEENIKNAYNKVLDFNKKITVVCGSFYLLSKLNEVLEYEN